MLVLPLRYLRRIPSHNINFMWFGQQKVSLHQYNPCQIRVNQCALNQAAFHTSQWHMKTVPFLLADIGEGIQEVVIKEWYIKEGQEVKQFDNVCEVQSDKASVTITCRYDGIVQKVYYAVDDTAIVGKPLLDVEVEKEGISIPIEDMSETVGAEVQEREAIAVGSAEEDNGGGTITLPRSNQKVLTTPAVRRIAMENKVDLSEVSGTGRDGRILKEDLMSYVANLTQGPGKKEQELKPILKTKPISIEQTKAPSTPPPMSIKKDTVVPIKGFTRTMVKTMTASMQIPAFLYCDEVNMSNLIQLKAEIISIFQKQQLKFSYMPFFLKAASIALQSYPILNSSLDEKCQNITYKSSHNIGFAMDTAIGLVVPNIKNIQELTILQITEEMSRLQTCGKNGSFSTLDLAGGTFTISNIGSIGGTYTQPRIILPEVAIVGLGKIQRLPRYSSTGTLEEAHIMNISWSADHRIIDGATLARFSNVWISCLENPTNMLLHMK